MAKTDNSSDFGGIIVHLARLAMAGRPQDVQAFLRQSVKRISAYDKPVAARISEILAAAPSSSAPLRDATTALVPVDADSRLALLRHEFPVLVEVAPVWTSGVEQSIRQVLLERENAAKLQLNGVRPTSTLLFEGPPGVGKTLTARWIASSLQRPLLVLDLATVVSSYLGKTGANIRAVLDYAKQVDCVLLLDEFDAIAKRRDDEADIGELKRLVNVLLQEVDDWPSSGILIAATNHGELLDRAVWRRFDEIIHFDLPSEGLRRNVITQVLSGAAIPAEIINVLTTLWSGLSFSDIVRFVDRAKRRAAVHSIDLAESLMDVVADELKKSELKERKGASRVLNALGVSDRRISALTGLSRDTLRKDRSKAGPVGESSEVADGRA